MSDVLEEWMKCQGQWMYLQPIFDSPDIAKCKFILFRTALRNEEVQDGRHHLATHHAAGQEYSERSQSVHQRRSVRASLRSQ